MLDVKIGDQTRRLFSHAHLLDIRRGIRPPRPPAALSILDNQIRKCHARRVLPVQSRADPCIHIYSTLAAGAIPTACLLLRLVSPRLFPSPQDVSRTRVATSTGAACPFERRTRTGRPAGEFNLAANGGRAISGGADNRSPGDHTSSEPSRNDRRALHSGVVLDAGVHFGRIVAAGHRAPPYRARSAFTSIRR